jgi:hypothetical protein
LNNYLLDGFTPRAWSASAISFLAIHPIVLSSLSAIFRICEFISSSILIVRLRCFFMSELMQTNALTVKRFNVINDRITQQSLRCRR